MSVPAHPPIVVSKVTSKLTVKVQTPDGAALPGASVEIWNLRGGYREPSGAPNKHRMITEANGEITFPRLQLLKKGKDTIPWYIKVNKEGHGPKADEAAWREGEVTHQLVPVEGKTYGPAEADPFKVPPLVLQPAKVDADAKLKTIIARVPRLPHLLNVHNEMPGKTATGPESSDPKPSNLTPGDAMIHVVVGTPVEVEVISDPPGKRVPAKWRVFKDKVELHGVLTVHEGGWRATLVTNEVGYVDVVVHHKEDWAGFCVNGSRVVVGDTKTHTAKQKDQWTGGAGGGAHYFLSGEWYPDGGKVDAYRDMSKTKGAFQAWAKVKIDGDQAGKIVLCWLQNGLKTSLKGKYKGGGTAAEVLKAIPVLDSSYNREEEPRPGEKKPKEIDLTPFPNFTGTNGKPQTPLTISDTSMKFDNLLGVEREFMFLDSPVTSFAEKHEKTQEPLEAVEGDIDFRLALGAYHMDYKAMVVVLAEVVWSAKYKAVIKDGKLVDNGSSTVGPDKLSVLSVPIDARSAGYVTGPPQFSQVGLSFVVEWKS